MIEEHLPSVVRVSRKEVLLWVCDCVRRLPATSGSSAPGGGYRLRVALLVDPTSQALLEEIAGRENKGAVLQLLPG